MTALPNASRTGQPYPRRRMTPGRVPPMNAMARGFGAGRFGSLAQQSNGGGGGGGGLNPRLIGPPITNTPPPVPSPGYLGPPNMQVPPTPVNPGQAPGPFVPRVNPNDLLGQPGRVTNVQGRDPLEHLRWWAAHGWDLGNNDRFRYTPQFNGGDGGGPGGGGWGGGPGGPGPGPGGGRPLPQPGPRPGSDGGPGGGGQGDGGTPGGGGIDQNVPGMMNDQQIHDLRRQFGLPLDPQYEATRRQLTDQLNATLAQALAGYTQGQGALGLQNQLSTDQANNDLAARGVYGSGLQNRSDRLIGNQYAQGLLGLNNDYYGQQSQAGLGFNQGLMEAMLALARRQASTPRNNAPRGGGR